MKAIKSILSVLVLMLILPTALSADQDLWNLGTSDDWLSSGPVYVTGPYYFPNSDLSTGFQKYLNTYPSYLPSYYPNYYPVYNTAILGGTTFNYTKLGSYPPSSMYNYPAYSNPKQYDPQYELDLAISNHAAQKFAASHYNHYVAYPW